MAQSASVDFLPDLVDIFVFCVHQVLTDLFQIIIPNATLHTKNGTRDT